MFKVKSDPEQMRYKPNSLSSILCIFSIIFNVAHFISVYSTLEMQSDFVIGIDVFINIVFMLFIFLGSVKTKSYQINWSYITLGFAMLQIARIFIVPLRFMLKDQYTGTRFAFGVSTLVLSAVCLILSSIICYIRSKTLNTYLDLLNKEVSNG